MVDVGMWFTVSKAADRLSRIKTEDWVAAFTDHKASTSQIG